MHIVVVGAANIDLNGRTENPLKFEDSNPGHVQTTAGGVGRNIAENLARLGAQTTFVTMLGQDLGQSVILNSCQQAGIDTASVLLSNKHSTGTYIAINDHQGHLTLALNDMAIYDDFTPDLLKTRKAVLDAADELVIEANLPAESLIWLCENYAHKPIHADTISATKVMRLKPVLNKLDVLKINRTEALSLLHQSSNDAPPCTQPPCQLQADTIDDRTLIEKIYAYGAKNVLLSLGAKGALLRCQQGLFQQPPYETHIQNDTGAGDSMLAGFIYARHVLPTQDTQLAFSLGCAALTLQTTHAVNPALSAKKIMQHYL